MPFQMLFIALSLLAPLLLSSLASSPLSCSPNTESWCKKTPYPQPCHYRMCSNTNSFATKQEPEFRKKSVQIALDQVLRDQSQSTTRLTQQSWHHKNTTASTGCLELYQDTIIRLNHTTENCGQSGNLDTQTWLTAALTNLETCRTSYMELDVRENRPLLSNNVFNLINNILAVNKVTLKKTTHHINRRKKLEANNVGSTSLMANLVVAKDGSGDFKKIKKEVNVASKRKETDERFVIYVKAGTYKEKVVIGHKGKNITMVGDGIGKTIVTGSDSKNGGYTTFKSATFAVNGDGFIAQDMTFRNTAGPSHGQAVALRSGIYSRTTQHKTNTITAQSRINANQTSGIVIHNSRVIAAPDENPVRDSVRTFLGRPWRDYSRTVFLETFLDNLIDPAGWLAWNNESDLSTLYYGEYENEGPGSSTENRVKWSGYHVINKSCEASEFAVSNFLAGDSWLPSTGVPYDSTCTTCRKAVEEVYYRRSPTSSPSIKSKIMETKGSAGGVIVLGVAVVANGNLQVPLILYGLDEKFNQSMKDASGQ
ncbi:hypothetical protein SADUNF_Sadunf01G0102300 [Salix dunnii]|uniref:Pectinesterase n=1 Tax=Salix dunnii TaxID=1413687 RepID=A0A835TK10_9ROSI|nr:hypothetical protein SADUNF_Sadunf01G0102300 [Salix dunnii]